MAKLSDVVVLENKEDFAIWSLAINNYAGGLGAAELLGRAPDPDNDDEVEKAAKLLSGIRSKVGKAFQTDLLSVTAPHLAVVALQGVCEPNTPEHIESLEQQLANLAKLPSESILEYFARAKMLRHRLGNNAPPENKTLMVLRRGLRNCPEFAIAANILQQNMPATIDYMRAYLMNVETEAKLTQQPSAPVVLAAAAAPAQRPAEAQTHAPGGANAAAAAAGGGRGSWGGGRGKGGSNGGGGGRGNRWRGGGGGRGAGNPAQINVGNRPDIQCDLCHWHGHFSGDCSSTLEVRRRLETQGLVPPPNTRPTARHPRETAMAPAHGVLAMVQAPMPQPVYAQQAQQVMVAQQPVYAHQPQQIVVAQQSPQLAAVQQPQPQPHAPQEQHRRHAS